MSRSRSKSRRRKKRVSRKLQVPNWYYGLLVVIAVIGISLIVAGWRSSPVDIERDYILGDPNAPVTIVDWGAFQ